MALDTPVFVRAYDLREIIFLLKSNLGFPSIIVDGMLVLDTPFLQRNVFQTYTIASTKDLTRNIVIYMYGKPLHEDLNLSILQCAQIFHLELHLCV